MRKFKSIEEKMAYYSVHPRKRDIWDIIGPPLRFLDKLIGRLIVIGTLGYGVYWGVKNGPEKVKEVKQAVVQNKDYQEIRESLRWAKDELKPLTPQQKAQREEAARIRRERIKEYQEMGIQVVPEYAKPGTKEFREEMEWRRKELYKGNGR